MTPIRTAASALGSAFFLVASCSVINKSQSTVENRSPQAPGSAHGQGGEQNGA